MTGHGSKFGRKKEEAIAALLTQRNIEEAARVTATTLIIVQSDDSSGETRRGLISISRMRGCSAVTHPLVYRDPKRAW